MPTLERTREFFAAGGTLLTGKRKNIAKALAGIGVAAVVAVLPYPAGNESSTLASYSGPHAAVKRTPPKDTADTTAPAALASNLTVGAALVAAVSDHAEEVVSLVDRQIDWLTDGLRLHSFGDYQVRQFVASEIIRAANDTGFPSDLLMAIAEQESAFDINARPHKGTALGLMQFIEQSWLEAVSLHGKEFGLADEAKDIKSVVKGDRTFYYLDDPAEQDRILELRRSPYLSAALAAKNLLDARARIEAKLDRSIEDDDIYLPHFLGTGGAGKLLAKVDEKPDAVAKKVFPKAARYNANLFKGKHGKALTVSQFHQRARNIIASKVGKYRNVEQIIAEAAVDMPEVPFNPLPDYEVSMLRR